MQMLGHYHITDQTKSRRIAHSSQFFQEEVSRSHRFQKRQSPVTTESNKVQIAFAVIAFKTRRHRQPRQKKQPPQDPGSHPEPGAPSVSLYFRETCRSDILSATQMSTNFKFSIRATRQSPITTESDKVQITFAIIAFKTRRHRQPQHKKQPPQH